jgi:hypothetical protein
MKLKKMPKAPKAPKSTSKAALDSYERRVKAFEAKCAEIVKYNKSIEAQKERKAKLKERTQKARSK